MSTQLLNKHTLKPEITLLFINFMPKKPCLKFPKAATTKIWIENAPPALWHFFESSSDLVPGSFP